MARPKRYETAAMRQKAYRERKKNLSRGATSSLDRLCSSQVEKEDSPPSQKSTVEVLREMIEREHERVVEEPLPKQLIYRNDYGVIITERQWNTLQEHKRRAKREGICNR